mmetsp:Transcript_28218/g.59686  ORF Transcript_28218/g.59686 Transcript_28218/m.59686 type:complete len:647 (+) Transcript_28218:147-2087(+)|eukprot:CAMPEP_0171351390 /NCGR_PEP_ID=MMETSP0878-20121228/38856_1 /TAXON_ID=67004 /ORGANISM="Thalassiosira weissflogii, Strain CCMP1336" /LENGTH=646 /DNA_ID=CAMNT_0011856633 /DNA_START=104 /DNA_END=2044 /DNA_ORIENTATION=+
MGPKRNDKHKEKYSKGDVSKKRKFDKSSSTKERKPKGDKEQTPANKKRALKAERQSHRKHATIVRSAKEIWNDLRVKSNTTETTSRLATELFDLLKGNMMEVAMQHDASRMVQAVIQFGNETEKRETVKELCGNNGGKGPGTIDKNISTVNLAELCKIQYAHFVVLKMIKYCARDEECVRLIVKNLKKQMTKLSVHAVGSRVVELLFATFPPKATTPLKHELYGPQYSLFASTTTVVNDSNLSPLKAFIDSNPDKREAILTHLQTLLQKGLDKSLTGFAYFHSLLHDYVSIASPNDIRDFLTPALVDHSLHLLSTRTGTRVVAECVAYGTVKDRKKILKCLKGYTRSSLLHRDAYLAVLRMVDVMDDTVLVNKMLLAELHQNLDADSSKEQNEETPSPILDLILSETGSKLLLLLLVPKDALPITDDSTNPSSKRWQKYLDPYEREVLHQNPTVIENGESVPTSKKDAETRRQELVVYLKDLLTDACTKHTEEMMRSTVGSRVLYEVCEAFPTEEIYSSILEACAESMEDAMSDDDDEQKSLSMFEDPVGHLVLKHLFLHESKKSLDEDELSFARMFYSKFHKEFLKIASSNRGAFVLAALLKVQSVMTEVKESLKKHKTEITKITQGNDGGDKLVGCKILIEALN